MIFRRSNVDCPSKFRDKPEGCERNLGVVTLKSEQLCGSERDCVRTIVRVARDVVTTGVAEGTAVLSENNRKTELAQGCETRLVFLFV